MTVIINQATTLKRHPKFNTAPALLDTDGECSLMSRCWGGEKEKGHAM